jgi:16S rRNA processing protein RimM
MRVEYIPVGQIVNAHGIKGEVKLNPMGFDPEFLADFDVLYIGGKRTEVKSARVHKSVVLLTLPGVNDMDAALALKGKTVTICRDDVEVPEGYYFDEEIEGLQVVDCATETVIGKVRRVLTYPAHKIYEVKGEREYLIPAVPGVFIESVDLDAETVRVHLMKGLATDEN